MVLHRYGNDADYRVCAMGARPARHDHFSQIAANPTPLFGVDLIDRIPDAVIEAAARRRHAGWPQIKGRPSRLADGRVGRFGWKAQTASLGEFVRAAAAVEMGLEVPGHDQAADPRVPPLKASGLDMDAADCDALVAYVRSLPAPKPIARQSEGRSGAQGGQGSSRPSAAQSATFRSLALWRISTATFFSM